MTKQVKSAANTRGIVGFPQSRFGGRVAMLCTASLLAAGWAECALAQPASPPAAAAAGDQPATTRAEVVRTEDEIVVTARKRQESILKVPVVMTAVTGEQLETFQI